MSQTGSQSVHSEGPAYKLSEKAVVYLESETFKARKFSAPAAHPLLDQKDLAFHPQVLPIVIGTTVEFPNRDNLFHNVFSYSQPREFDLGRYPTGDSRSVRFERPGVVRVYCDIHAHMNATILVLDNPYFTTPDDNGNYSLKDIPEGVFTLKLWYGRDVLESRPITVRTGEVTTANFTH
jgi:plastocyanin